MTVLFYKGLYKVKVLTKSEGYWIIEALEEFEDQIDGKKVIVKIREQRIVPSHTVHKRKSFKQPIREHAYELKMEEKLKRLILEEEKKKHEKDNEF